MRRYVFNDEDREWSLWLRSEGHEARKLRRMAELALLNRVLAEAAMPERYPER